MLNSFLILLGIVVMLAVERVAALKFTTIPAGKAFIRRHFFLHPNGISILRLPQGVISIYFAYLGYWELAILWFAFWMISDLTDGTIARNCDLVTETGKWLDPLSDKCMHFPALLFLALSKDVTPRLPITIVIIYCIIDTLGQCSRLFTTKTAANSFGKAKTALVTVLISAIALRQLAPDMWMPERLINAIMIFCLVLSFLSFYCKVIPNNWYANSLTFMNFLCGLFSIYLTLFGNREQFPNIFILAFLMVFLGQFFDLFDGRLARKFGSTKRGALFDDIADATSFGVAVACLIFKALITDKPELPKLLVGAVAFFYMICLFFRLYRFLHPTRKMPKGIFQGMPAPAGALLASSAVLSLRFSLPGNHIIAIIVVIITSLLMISNMPYRHFGQNFWPSLPKAIKLLVLILLMILFGCANAERGWAVALIWLCSSLSVIYTIFGISIATLKGKLQPEDAPPTS